MNLTIKKYISVDNTLENIKAIIKRHWQDNYLRVFDSWPLKKIHDYVRQLPYIPDPTKVPISNNDNIELLKSPYFTIWTNGGDCDDKAILICCILQRRKIAYRMAVVSTQAGRDFHHIYPEIFYKGAWVPFDATYSYNKPFVENKFAAKRIYDWTCGNTIAYNLEKNSQITHSRQLNCAAVKTDLARNPKLRAEFLRGMAVEHGLAGEKLAILEGLPARSYTQAGVPYINRQAVINNARQLLGVDPVSIIATAGAVARIFGSIFGRTAYQDAYNVWNAAAGSLPQNVAQADWANAGINRAIVAVLGVDYMNPPGKNVCTSSNRCGNRAEWSVIQPEVEAKVSKVAPFFAWLSATNTIAHHFPLDMNGMYRLYNDYKTGGPAYQQFLTATSSQQKKTNTAGGNTSTLLTLAAIGAVGYLALA